MKNIFFILLILITISCTHNDKSRSENLLKKEVMDSAIKYASDKFREAKATTKDDIVTVIENQVNFVSKNDYKTRYVINPAKIVIGLIDDDTNEDAIINIIEITGQDTENPENLIFIQKDGKFILSRVIESNMKVLGIKERIITAEVSTQSLNSPLRDCHVCKEVVKYQFRAGDLVRIN